MKMSVRIADLQTEIRKRYVTYSKRHNQYTVTLNAGGTVIRFSG